MTRFMVCTEEQRKKGRGCCAITASLSRAVDIAIAKYVISRRKMCVIVCKAKREQR